MKKNVVLAWTICFFILAGSAMANEELKPSFQKDSEKGGIKFNYSKVFVENLPVGKKISMAQIANYPLEVTNKFDIPMLIVIDVETITTPARNFEPIPSTRWVTTQYQTVTVAAHGVLKSDVMIDIPNDPQLFGKRYAVGIAATTKFLQQTGGLAVGYAVHGSLLFTIAPQRNDAALAEIQKHPVNTQFEIVPPRVDLWRASPGEKIKVVSETNKPLVLRNLSKKMQSYVLASVDPAPMSIHVDDGAVYCGNPDLVVLGQDEIKLGSRKTQELEIEVQVPSDADLKKNALAYFVAVGSGMKMGAAKYISIYLHGGDKPVTQDDIHTVQEQRQKERLKLLETQKVNEKKEQKEPQSTGAKK